MRELSCGQMAAMNTTTKRTLRYYQEKGLIAPSAIRGAANERVYSVEQATKLDMIAHLKSAGLSLEDIKLIDDAKSADLLEQKVLDQIEACERKMSDLAVEKYIAQEIVSNSRKYADRPPLGNATVESLPDRLVLTHRIEPAGGEGCRPAHSLLETSVEWEHELHDFKNYIADRKWPLALFRNAGAIYDEAAAADEPLRPTRLFVLADPVFGSCINAAEQWQGGPHLTMYYSVSCDDDGNSLDAEQARSLVSYASAHGYKATGPLYCEPLFRFPRHFRESYDALFRYCLPIAPTN